MNRRIIAVTLLGISGTALGQGQADIYRQAAQVYNNAAAQCPSPAGAACYRQYASYNSCLANHLGGGGSCGSAPSCSASCTGSGSGSGVGGSLGSAGSGLTQKQQLALTGLNLAIQWLSNRHHNDGVAPSEAQAAADAARVQAAIAEANIAFENQVMLRNALTSGADPSTVASGPGQSSDDPTVALRNQLTAGNGSSGAQDQPIESDSTASFNSASGDTSPSTPADPATSATNSPAEPAPDPSITQPTPGYVSPLNPQSIQTAMTPPSSSPMSAAFQQSADDSSATTPTVADSVMNSIKAIPGRIEDGLDSVMSQMSSVKTSLTNLWNDPSVQMMNQVREGDYTTVPLPNSTDTPGTALNKTFAQSILGFGDLRKGPKGLYDYGTKMVNQMGAYLGLANEQLSPGDTQ